jgi:hypothetical protein
MLREPQRLKTSQKRDFFASQTINQPAGIDLMAKMSTRP